ncbi:MAG TPA: ATP-binding protein [Ornithinibacter sp.]|nr:ATP-binding protein [Ornithinibacter sp.]
MVAFVGVAVGALVVSWLVVRSEAQRDAEVAARAIAHSIVAPLADDDFHDGDPAALARMGQVMENRARDGSIAHIKVWDDAGKGRGTVLWSDLAPLIGQSFEMEDEEYAVFGTNNTVSDISDLHKVENKMERSDGQLIEVYTGTKDASGAPILLEIYLSTAALPTEVRTRIREILPLPILALIALSLATLPLAVSLAHRVDRGQVHMRRLLINAVESTDLERRRVAQDLHDGVVQDLAGIGYSLESEAQRLPGGGALREHLEHIGEILRRDVAALRTLMADIYPPDLETKGLARAVRDLGIRQNQPPGVVRVEINGPLGQHPVTDRLIYRAVREALGNALRHAQASSVVIRIAQEDGRMTFEVVDDGVGFDPAAAGPEGHLGMRLISEMVVDAGGVLVVESVAGEGTRVHGELPL